MKKLASLLASLAFAILAAGCGGKGSSADFPADFKVVAGDAAAVVTWTPEPDVEYWIFYGPGSDITTQNWATAGGSVIPKANSPYVVTGLVNGTTYSFTINGRKGGGPGGTAAPTQVVLPQLAGATWTSGEPLGSGRLNGVAAGTGLQGVANVSVGAGGAIFSSIASGATAARVNPAAPADLNAVWYGGVGFVAAGANGTLLFSYDTLEWTVQTSGTTAALYGGTSLGNGGFAAVGAAGTILTSTNGISWAVADSGTANDLYAAAYGNGRYIAVGANGTVLVNTEGTWVAAASGTTTDLRGIAFGSVATDPETVIPTFVAVGANGTILTSSDGTAWVAQAPATTIDLAAVVFGGQFVAVGKSGTILTSPDGLAWEARTSGTASDLAAVGRTLTGYTAVGDAGTNVSTF